MTVAVRTDHEAAELRAQAKVAVTPDQARRLLAIALLREGSSRADAAQQHRPSGAWARPRVGSARPSGRCGPRPYMRVRSSRELRHCSGPFPLCQRLRASFGSRAGPSRQPLPRSARAVFFELGLPLGVGPGVRRARRDTGEAERAQDLAHAAALARAARGQRRSHEPASGRDQPARRRRRPRGRHPRPGGLARRQGPAHPRQPLAVAAAALQPGAQPGREPLAVPRAQLPQRPGPPNLRGRCRCLLRRLEPLASAALPPPQSAPSPPAPGRNRSPTRTVGISRRKGSRRAGHGTGSAHPPGRTNSAGPPRDSAGSYPAAPRRACSRTG